MSFSNDVRNELARVMPEKACCRKAELSALLAINGNIIDEGRGNLLLKVFAENAATARKIFTLLKESYQLQSSVRVEKSKRFKKVRRYEVDSIFKYDDLWIFQELNLLKKKTQARRQLKRLRSACCKRAYLRGIFLSRGFINRPEGNYHLEIVLNDAQLLDFIQRILENFDIEARSMERKHHLVLYIKESEKIVDFLRVVGANTALLEFENVRIIKSMRNNVNRQVNCETANLAKTIDASVRQIELIKRLNRINGLEALSPQLRELAMMRIAYPDSTLKELGFMLDPPLSKSGVAYRMRKLENLAEDILDNGNIRMKDK